VLTSWHLHTSDGEREPIHQPVSLAEALDIAQALAEVSVEVRFVREEVAGSAGRK